MHFFITETYTACNFNYLCSLVHGIPRPALMASASPAPLYQPLAVVCAFLLGQGSQAPAKSSLLHALFAFSCSGA